MKLYAKTFLDKFTNISGSSEFFLNNFICDDFTNQTIQRFLTVTVFSPKISGSFTRVVSSKNDFENLKF